MKAIQCICFCLLLLSLLVLQWIGNQNQILFIRADGETSIAGYVSNAKVVTLEEADRRYNELHGYALPNPDADYGKHCLFGSCSLEVTLLMAKYSLANWLRL